MERRMIVMVVDPDDPKRGEITILDDPSDAAHMAEALLEAGMDQERVRIYSASEIQMTVSHRPVVTLVGGEREGAAGDAGARGEATGASDGEAPVEGDEGTPPEGEEAEPFVQNGVRFSSLFRSS